MMQDPKQLGSLVTRVAASMAGALRGDAKQLEALAQRAPNISFERGSSGQLLSDGGKALLRDLQGPLQTQLQAELGGRSAPKDVAVIFGHTHKPFETMMEIDNFLKSRIEVYNSGGWVVDTPEPQRLYGGAAILLDEHLNIASLRMYNESKRASGYAVRVETVSRKATNPLYRHLSNVVKSSSQPWRLLGGGGLRC